jgi:hypothetical protein
MKTQTDNGGPAFPTQNGCRYDAGMSLRDYFAAAALQGILVNKELFFDQSNEATARCAYEVADAMLTARKEEA